MPSVATPPTETNVRLDAPGGKYRASQNTDGTWNIFDVPIFGEMPEGERENVEPIGRDWMEKAVSLHEQREREGYLPPLHLYHHGTEKKTHPAGHFALRRVSRLSYGGKPMWAIFADFIRIPQSVFSAIDGGMFPFRSVEIANWESGEIASLALMDDDAPFFKLPLLSIGEKVENPEVKPVHPEMSGMLVGMRDGKAPKSRAYLFSFKGGVKMADEPTESEKKMKPAETKKDPETGAPSIEQIYKMLGAMAKKVGMSFDEEGNETPAEEKKEEEKKEEKPGEPAKASDAVTSAPPVDNAVAKAPVEAPNPGKGAAVADEVKIQLASQAGKIAALEEKASAKEREESVAKLVSKAESDLKGYNLSAATKQQLPVFAAQGEKILTAFVDSIKRDLPKDPPATLQAFENGEGKVIEQSIPSEVMKFAEKGPDALEAAKSAFREWKANSERGMTKIKLARWLELNVKA